MSFKRFLCFAITLFVLVLSAERQQQQQQHPSLLALDELEDVWNCRDAAWNVPGIRQGKLFRCGNPDGASEKDMKLIQQHLGKISNILDLRLLEEVNQTAPRRLKSNGDTKYHSVPLGNREMLAKVLTSRATWTSIGKYLYYRFIKGDKQRAQSEFIPYLGGLLGFNKMMLLFEGPAINKALRLLTISLESGNVLVHCTAGKDRTGLIVALSLAIAGLPRDPIALEYHQSHRLKHVIRKKALQHYHEQITSGVNDEAESLKIEQGIEEWSGAPSEVIVKTFEFIEAEFGTFDLFLSSIGFDYSWRERLRTALNKEETGRPLHNYCWNSIL